MANTINEVMDKNPLDLTDNDLDRIIADERRYKAQADSGVKAKRGDSGPKVDLGKLGLKKKVDLGELEGL